MPSHINYLEMLRSSFTLVILIGCSILSFTYMVERWLFFRRAEVNVDGVLSHVKKLIDAGQMPQAQAYCQKNPAAVAQVIYYGLLHLSRPRKDIEELLQTKRLEERLKLEHSLGILGTLGNISPFVGLFGTVVGIIKAFQDLALSGSGGPSVVAAGIAEALVATAGGLLVAIPAVIAYNYFMRRVKTIGVDMEVASTRLLVMLGTN